MILCVFQDRIYWTDRDRAAVFMANRLTGQDIHTLAENLNDPHDIVVFHQLRQPQGMCVQYVTVWAVSHLCDHISSVGPCRPRHMNKWYWDSWLWWSDQSVGSSSTFTHLSKPLPPTPFSPTGQSRIELNWAEHLIMNVMVVYFLCCLSVFISIYLCPSVTFYFFIPVHGLCPFIF